MINTGEQLGVNVLVFANGATGKIFNFIWLGTHSNLTRHWIDTRNDSSVLWHDSDSKCLWLNKNGSATHGLLKIYLE